MRPQASVLVFTLALAGCGTSPTPLRDAGPVDATDRTEVARSMSFLLTHFEHTRTPSADGTVIGVDLDDRVSAGDAEAADCRDRHADRRSPLGVDGVDNQVLAGFFPYAIEHGWLRSGEPEATFDESIASGARLHVVRVGELEDLVDDPEVRVEILVVARPDCEVATCPLGELREGEVFVERAMPLADVRGAIVDGRLRFSLASYLVDDEATPLHDAILDLVIGERGLSGVIGGGLDIQEINDLNARITPHPPPVESSLLWDFSDLAPSATDPSRCEQISMALELEAVRVFVPFGER